MSGCLSKYGGYTRYMSADTAARHEEFDRLITKRLKEMEEKNEILRGLKRLSDENRIDQVWSRYKGLRYGDERNDYLQQELNVTFNMRDPWVKEKKFRDVFCYYLLKNEEPVSTIQELIYEMIFKMRCEGWYEKCTHVFGSLDMELQLYKQTENEPQYLEYLIYKHPQLLFNEYSLYLIRRLRLYKKLPYDNLHQILLSTRDENGQTCMFHNLNHYMPTCRRDDGSDYINNFDDLCELLSVRDKSGKTALHGNSGTAYCTLLTRITLKGQDKVKELLSIRDNNNKTAHDTTDYWKKELTWLTRQYKRKKYPLYNVPRVLIIYNTKNREGAEAEAESIQQAFKSVKYFVELEKMGTKDEVLQLIGQRAAKWNTSVLIVCLMSHGNIGTINDSEENPITLTSIEEAMCSEPLKGQPKILIIQGSQTRAGGRKRTNEEATSSNTDPGRTARALDNPPYEPTSADFLSVQSSVSGQKSKINFFIPYLAEQIKKSSMNDGFVDLVEEVILRMKRETSEQIPIVKTTLGGKVCLKDRCPRLLSAADV